MCCDARGSSLRRAWVYGGAPSPYDDFNATHIALDKWFGGEYSSALPGASTEAIRQIHDHRLHLVYRSYGPTDADSGRLRNELVLMFRDPAAVTAIQAVVQVIQVETTGCPGNPEPTVALAMLGGRFFGSPPRPRWRAEGYGGLYWDHQVSGATALTSSRHARWSSIVRIGPARPAWSSTGGSSGP